MTTDTPAPAPAGSRLERELRDQGRALARRESVGLDAAEAAAALLRGDDVQYLCIAARGSSDNAARYAQYALGAGAQLNVALAAPSLFSGADRPPRLHGAAVMAVSQSGQSPDIVAVLAAARDQGRPTIAITNDESSPLAAEADVVVPLATGSETSVAATKTYLASLHAVLQLLECLRPSAERRRCLAALPELVDSLVEDLLSARAMFDPLDEAAGVTVAGRGLDFATAHETALKIRELAALTTEAFSPPDLMHGPIAGVAPGSWFWLVATGAPQPASPSAALLATMQDRSLPAVVVSADRRLRRTAELAVALPAEAPPWAASVLGVIPGQVAALRLAEKRGVDIDEPNGLSKVTLTQ